MTPTKQKSKWVGAMDSDYPAVQISVKVDCINKSSLLQNEEYADEFEQDEETTKDVIKKLAASAASPSTSKVTFDVDEIIRDPNEGKSVTVETNTDDTSGEEGIIIIIVTILLLYIIIIIITKVMMMMMMFNLIKMMMKRILI